ncbi:probable transcription factor At5g28040 [Oryza brachyantha]|uniref:Glabrous enhancer-binding protein-like DBD domain-containing protein n=1 Tax=Oryza brachyantha TaxID=4533 RepID=J3MNC6_ORYBR|nr:probable transcription factor At5g28040 [Oryza brachyantha]
MLPAAAAAMSFPDADVDDDSDDGDFTDAPLIDPTFPNPTSSSAAAAPVPPAAGGGGGGVGSSSGGGGERRPLFQRLWTEEDEIVILRGFAEFTAARGTAFASHQYDTDPFYEDMRGRLQLGFSKSQLVEKLRRLKRKYRNCVSRLRGSGSAFSFRSPHEQAIFEIARNIWRPANKHGREGDSDDEDAAAAAAVTPAAIPVNNTSPNGEVKSPTSGRQRRRRRVADFAAAAAAAPATVPATTNMVQPLHPVQVPVSVPVKMDDMLPALSQTTMPITVTMEGSEPLRLPVMPPQPAILDAEKSCLTPLFKEMVRAVINIGSNPFGAQLPEPPHGLPMEGEKWRKQRILELEVYLKRIELLKDQVKATLEELKSSAPGT